MHGALVPSDWRNDAQNALSHLHFTSLSVHNTRSKKGCDRGPWPLTGALGLLSVSEASPALSGKHSLLGPVGSLPLPLTQVQP